MPECGLEVRDLPQPFEHDPGAGSGVAGLDRERSKSEEIRGREGEAPSGALDRDVLRSVDRGEEPQAIGVLALDGLRIPAALGDGDELLQVADADAVVRDGETVAALLVVEGHDAGLRPASVLHQLAEHGDLAREPELQVPDERLLVHLECDFIHGVPPSVE